MEGMDLAAIAALITTLFALYKAVCFVMDRYSVGDKRKMIKANMEGTRNSMREIIRIAHHDHITAGWIDEDDLEHIEKTYECYKALGGNGTATRWMDELKNLPRQEV